MHSNTECISSPVIFQRLFLKKELKKWVLNDKITYVINEKKKIFPF